MNSNADEQKLDLLLIQWADQCSSKQRLADLHDRIVSALVESDSDFAVTEVPASGSNSRRLPATEQWTSQQYHRTRSHWVSGFAVGTVLTILVTLGMRLCLTDHSSASYDSDLPPEYAWLQKEQIHNKAILFEEMENLFDHKLAWVAETGQKLEFGLDPSVQHDADQGDQIQSRECLAVRIIIEQRQPGNGAWKLVWAMDVTAQDEGLVRVAEPHTGKNSLLLWAYRLPDGAISVESEIELAGGNQMHVQAAGLHQNAVPVKVLTALQNGTEYRIFQAVAVLNEEVI